jgi:hypothetical protein
MTKKGSTDPAALSLPLAAQQGLPVSARGGGVIRRLAQGATSTTTPRRGRPRSSPTARPGRYACEENGCGRLFDRRYNLKVHMRMHDGAMPFSCSSCDRKFRWRASLHHHLRAHLRSEEAALRALDPPDMWTASAAPAAPEDALAPRIPVVEYPTTTTQKEQLHQHHAQIRHEQLLQHNFLNLEQQALAEQRLPQPQFSIQRREVYSTSQKLTEVAIRESAVETRCQPRPDQVSVIEVIESCRSPTNRNDHKTHYQCQPSVQKLFAPQIQADLQERTKQQTLVRDEPALQDQMMFPVAFPSTPGGGLLNCSPNVMIPLLNLPPIASPSWASECSSASTRTNLSAGQLSSVDDLNVVLSPREELEWSLLDFKSSSENIPVSPSAISDVTVKREEPKLLTPDEVDEIAGFHSFIDQLAIGPGENSDCPASHEVDCSVVRSFR